MSFCPHCGFNLSKDEPIERDGFTLDPRGTIAFAGKPLKCSQSQFTVLHSIASGHGRPVSAAAIIERLGSETDRPQNLVHVHLAQAKGRNRDVPWPIKTVWGRGWKWEIAA